MADPRHAPVRGRSTRAARADAGRPGTLSVRAAAGPRPFFGEPASDAALVLLALAAFALYRYARSKSRTRYAGSPRLNAGKEKELLRAIERRGEITAARAALETPLSVEEADRMLGDLAARGHLRVHATDGRLSYTL